MCQLCSVQMADIVYSVYCKSCCDPFSNVTWLIFLVTQKTPQQNKVQCSLYREYWFLVVLNTECITEYLQAELLLIKNNLKPGSFFSVIKPK